MHRVIGFIAGSGLNLELAFLGGIMGHLLITILRGQLGIIPLLALDFRGELFLGKSLGFNLGALYSVLHCVILVFKIVDVSEVCYFLFLVMASPPFLLVVVVVVSSHSLTTVNSQS